ncbi:hypothetical protein K469DRAFT_298887 [Zopfia rhizophila CBS 207.26]|uniref:Uncharacterized protein n=1 Tax=Zopfia rhizophila CBS 207.26 TaxID=1314779 RepID=A0A6A6DJN0_9PEZI|nr:hypothetical protein K469DRAFT_298887 [Zopfia rhizophila CBS 207.26]
MVKVQDFSVGEVSGMVAAAVFATQLFVPIALPLILVALLKERNSSITVSAVSWSVIRGPGEAWHNLGLRRGGARPAKSTPVL